MPYGIQTNLTSLPPWYEALYRNLGEKAAAQAKAPYAAYKSPRIAPFSPDMTRSFDMTRGSMGAYLPYLQGATRSTQGAMEEFDNKTPYQRYFASVFPEIAKQYKEWNWKNPEDRARISDAQVMKNLFPTTPAGQIPDKRTATNVFNDLSARGRPEAKLFNPSPFDEASNVDKYMNPYVQNVLDRISNESGQFLNEKILPSLESHFVSSGAPRSGQHLRMVGQAGRDVQKDMEDRQRSYLSQAYDQAGKNFSSDQNRRLQSGENMARLGQYAQAGNIADVAALQEQGRLQQQQKQGELDVPYQDFLRQQNYPWGQLEQQSAIMHGIPAPTQTTGVVQTPGQPQVNTLGGLGSLAGSLYGARMFAGKKRGGHITGVSLPKAAKPPKVRKPPAPSFGLSTLRFKPKSSKNLIRGRR